MSRSRLLLGLHIGALEVGLLNGGHLGIHVVAGLETGVDGGVQPTVQREVLRFPPIYSAGSAGSLEGGAPPTTTVGLTVTVWATLLVLALLLTFVLVLVICQ